MGLLQAVSVALARATASGGLSGSCWAATPAALSAAAAASTASAVSPAAAAVLGGQQQWQAVQRGGTRRRYTAGNVLVTGAGGQIGSELVPFLRSKLGTNRVIATDLRPCGALVEQGPFATCDVVDRAALEHLVAAHGVTAVVHLATVLSAVGERNPGLAHRVNTVGIQNVLELAAGRGLQVYAPSTIAVFGPDTPRHATPDDTVTRPTTMYGITKVHQELLGQYYQQRYGVDFRSLRYPGVISALSPPGGGTTDYAVTIFHAALLQGAYSCFLPPDAELPMMYMPDCIEATWRLLAAPRAALTRSTYNVTAMSFTPAQLAAAIRRRLPHFQMGYEPDFRAAIAASWPASLDDSLARQDWGWQPKFDLQATVDHMLATLPAVLRMGAAPLQQQPAGSDAAAGVEPLQPAVAEVSG